MRQMPWVVLALIGCGGDTDCKVGFEEGKDGNCYEVDDTGATTNATGTATGPGTGTGSGTGTGTGMGTGTATGVTTGPPDLVFTSIDLDPTTSSGGQTITVTFRVDNDGGAPSVSANIDFRLSTDNVYNLGDTPVCSAFSGPVAPGSWSGTDINCILPGEPAGDYFIVGRVDNDELVIESDETNNDASAAITLQ